MRFKRELASFADVEVRTPTTKEQLHEAVKHEALKAARTAASLEQNAAPPPGHGDEEPAEEGGSDGGGASGSSRGADRPANRHRDNGRPAWKQGKKDQAEEDCAKVEGVETGPTGTEETEAERTEAEPAGTAPVEDKCDEGEPAKKEPAGSEPTEPTAPNKEKEETTPSPTTPSEAESPGGSSSTSESTTSSAGVALRLPFSGQLLSQGLVWRS